MGRHGHHAMTSRTSTGWDLRLFKTRPEQSGVRKADALSDFFTLRPVQ